MSERFSRTRLLIGERGMETLAASTVAVFGLGGVGSYATEALARAGIGNLVLVDDDVVAISNINRQLHALEDTLGVPKTQLMGERVKSIHPSIQVILHNRRYTPENRESFFVAQPDYVVDAIDDLAGKIDLIEYCFKNGIPLVSSMGAGNKLDPTQFKVEDISKTSVCPLARMVRRQLRQKGITKGVKVVYSMEEPQQWEDELESEKKDTQKVLGSISFVPSAAGLILAGVVVRDLIKLGAQANK